MEQSLSLNGKIYREQELVDFCSDTITNSGQEWERDYCRFIMEWLNDSDTVWAKTSGSTGKPKKICLSKQKMMNSARLTGEFFKFEKGQSALLCLSPNFIAGKMMIVRAFVWQLDLVTVAPDGYPLKDVDREIDFAAMLPLQVKNSLSRKKKLNKIKNLLIGGGALYFGLEEAVENLKVSCFIGYGMTETVSHVAIRKLNGKNKSQLYTAIGNAKFSIDCRECLCIDAPEVLEEKLTTNDVVVLKGSNKFEWKGRYDNVVNSGGIKLFPEQIEKKIEKLFHVPFFVGALPDEHLGQKLVLLIEGECKNELEKNNLKEKLKSLLDKYEQAREIFYLPGFKRTLTGKIQREATLLALSLSR